MSDFRGIIFAYNSAPELHELVIRRTAASLPVCARYRLIDFALSSLRNAGIFNVGIIMQRDYQSLLDHIGSGKPWDMSRKDGGLRLLPPFGLPDYHRGNYSGTMEALNAVGSYVRYVPEKYIVLLLGNVLANIDIAEVCRMHVDSGAKITAICTDHLPAEKSHRYMLNSSGLADSVLFDREESGEGIPSLEGYVINKDTLLRLMDQCRSRELYRFHKDALSLFLQEGGKMDVYIHKGYARIIRTVDSYFHANMDMLRAEIRAQVLCSDSSRVIRSKHNGGVSTYYGETARAQNSLVADNCIINGSIENCIVFSGVVIEPGAKLKNCIVMKGSTIGCNAKLTYVIADKFVEISPSISLTGNERLPVVVPKAAKI